MPMYEFRCADCGHAFEKLVKSLAGPVVAPCPACQSDRTARELSVFAVGSDTARPASAPAGCGRCGGPGPCAMG